MDDGIAPDKVAAEGGSFSGAVQRMFDALAPRYDAFNCWASLGLDRLWRRAAVRELRVPADGRVLDVASGTGDVALAALARSRRAFGCDFATEMVRRARDKAAERGHGDGALFQVARAEALPYRDDSFDGVLSAFAMRNVRPMLDDVLAESLRVLRPGARLIVLEFSEPAWQPARAVHGWYTRALIPRIGGWLTGDREPFDYLSRSIDAWEGPRELADRIRRVGFVDVGFRRLSLGAVALHWGAKPTTS